MSQVHNLGRKKYKHIIKIQSSNIYKRYELQIGNID